LPLYALAFAKGLEPVADVVTKPLRALGIGCLTVTLHRIAPSG
jgi:hypothetical protein